MVKILTLLTLPLFGICASFANDGFDIVSNGQAKTEIVLPVRANRIEKYAAEELSEHIRKSTGVLLPIVRENRLKGDMPRIYLGKTRFALQHGIDAGGLPPNAYLKKVSPQAVILAGRDGNGTLPQDTDGNVVRGLRLSGKQSRSALALAGRHRHGNSPKDYILCGKE